MRKRAVEREIQLIAKFEPEAVLQGQVDGRDAEHAILANGVDVDIQLAAHHLGHVHLRGDRTLVACVREHDVLGADAEDDLLGLLVLRLERFLHLFRHIDDCAVHADNVSATLDRELRIEEVHLRGADESGDEEVCRVVEHLLRGTDLLDVTVFHDDDSIAQRHGLGLVVGDVHKRGVDVLAELDELGAHLVTQLCVEVAQRFVHEEDLRMTHDGAADGDALALAAGERFGLSLQILGDAEDLRRFLHLLVDLRLGNLAQLESERHVFIHGHVRIERVVLEDHRDVAVFRRNIVDEAVADVEFTIGDLFQTGDHAQSCRLAAARGSDEYDKLFVRDFKRKLLNRDHVFVVDLFDVLECYVCHSVSASSGAAFAHRPTRNRPKKIDGRITAGLHTAAPQAMRMGIPPFVCVAVNKKWSKPRALEYREMLLILLQTGHEFATLKSRIAFSTNLRALASKKPAELKKPNSFPLNTDSGLT